MGSGRDTAGAGRVGAEGPVNFSELGAVDLLLDSRYAAGPAKNYGADPISKLLPVGNQGGFRYTGSAPSPKLVVLYSSGTIPEWPDELDTTNGVLTYYGDNRTAGSGIHETRRKGNLILCHAFEALHGTPRNRAETPIFLYFESDGASRDVTFRGLVVPGGDGVARDDELVAVWRTDSKGRFQNYKAQFTVLDIPVVTRAWIQDVLSGNPLSSNAPSAWVNWVNRLAYQRLSAERNTLERTRDQQLPSVNDHLGWRLLTGVYEAHKSDPYSFEPTAVSLAKLVVPLSMEMSTTRKSADGGRDAIGQMRVGDATDPVWLQVSLEAKCYAPGKASVGVSDTSRLISRLRHRDVGFLVTTSFVGQQAYRELREDKHPVLVISGGDIVRHLRRVGVHSAGDFHQWLASSR